MALVWTNVNVLERIDWERTRAAFPREAEAVRRDLISHDISQTARASMTMADMNRKKAKGGAVTQFKRAKYGGSRGPTAGRGGAPPPPSEETKEDHPKGKKKPRKASDPKKVHHGHKLEARAARANAEAARFIGAAAADRAEHERARRHSPGPGSGGGGGGAPERPKSFKLKRPDAGAP